MSGILKHSQLVLHGTEQNHQFQQLYGQGTFFIRDEKLGITKKLIEVVVGGGARVNTKDSSSPMTLPIFY